MVPERRSLLGLRDGRNRNGADAPYGRRRQGGTVFRTKGIAEDLDAPKGSTTETEYRFETKDGVVFCEQCGSQVSPSDKTCPACDHALRVERPKNADSREPATEF